jgi:starch phosphorylase
MKDFVEFYGISKFSNVTNGVTPRRWLDQCNPALSQLITDTLKIPKSVWLKDLTKLQKLVELADDAAFQKKWADVKQQNKERLAKFVENAFGIKVNTKAMFDVQVGYFYFQFRSSLISYRSNVFTNTNGNS